VTTNTESGTVPSSKQCTVLEKYIQNPSLVEGRKYDVRVYVFFRQLRLPGDKATPPEVWLFNDGILRFASEPYTSSVAGLNDQVLQVIICQLVTIVTSLQPRHHHSVIATTPSLSVYLHHVITVTSYIPRHHHYIIITTTSHHYADITTPSPRHHNYIVIARHRHYEHVITTTLSTSSHHHHAITVASSQTEDEGSARNEY
jgi:hypothetical protein